MYRAFCKIQLSGSFLRAANHSWQACLARLDLYRAHPDKSYSLTDCISMQTMRREGLRPRGSADERSVIHSKNSHVAREQIPRRSRLHTVDTRDGVCGARARRI